ncbi:thiamine phosphate synthase [Fusibacter bizertensis]
MMQLPSHETYDHYLKHRYLDRIKYALYLVTDQSWTKKATLEAQVEAAILGGVTMVQLREKTLDDVAFLALAVKIKAITDRYNVPLLINDNVYVAKAIGCSGVHVGQSDAECTLARKELGVDAIVGVSVTTVKEALKAEAEGADYLGVGAMFTTLSKEDAASVRLETLREITSAVTIPVVAIGGINYENQRLLKESGIAGISVISAVLSHGEPEMITKASHELFEGICETLALTTPKLTPVLTIAGSDCSGGAGIQADLKTFAAHGKYGMSVITALTAQNTLGVSNIANISPDFVRDQLKAIFEDIKPMAIKIGMVSSPDIIRVIAEELVKINKYGETNNCDESTKGCDVSKANAIGTYAKDSNHGNHANIPIVLDPVMVSTSGSKLIEDEAISALISDLMPLVTMITPNIHEAELLSKIKIESREDMVRAAKIISHFYTGAILIKGGHLKESSADLLYYQLENDKKNEENEKLASNDTTPEIHWFEQMRISNPNTHGTGCTLSSAIACALTETSDLTAAVAEAKAYVTGALYSGLNLGKGSGPLNHGWIKGVRS